MLLASNDKVARALGTTEASVRQYKARHAAQLVQGKHFVMTEIAGTPHTMWTAAGMLELSCGMTRAKNARAFREGLLAAIVISCRSTSARGPITFQEVLNYLVVEHEVKLRLIAERAARTVTEAGIPPMAKPEPIHMAARRLGLEGLGPVQLLDVLRTMGVLQKRGRTHNLAYQKFITRGYFVNRVECDGTRERMVSYITPKGVEWLHPIAATWKIDRAVAQQTVDAVQDVIQAPQVPGDPFGFKNAIRGLNDH